ncbi:MAG TPA: insulinase family protein, partial [Peptostreptococcaceae bacterium]|nr:insulinase family protein [Peptostreptococcaceae bacterium]
VYKLIIEEIKELKTNYLTQDEIDESREQLKGSFILGLESTSSRMMTMGKSQLLSEEIDTPKDILDYINKVDMKQVKSVIDKVFDLDNIAVSLVGKDVEGIVL